MIYLMRSEEPLTQRSSTAPVRSRRAAIRLSTRVSFSDTNYGNNAHSTPYPRG